MINRKVTSVWIGIFLIGMVSAVLVPYISNTVTGTATVKGPVFYASAEHPLNGSTYWGLGINNYTGRATPVSFTGSNPKIFVSKKLGINSFYPANYKISIEANSSNESGQIDANIYFIEGDNPYNRKLEVCSGSVNPIYNKSNYTINCQAGELKNINPNWRLVLELSDGLNNIKYEIYLQGNTKIEVIPQ